jgi:hypothetical protein
MAFKPTPAPNSKEGSITTPKPFDRFLSALMTEAQATAEFQNSGDISREIVGNMIVADSLEGAIAAQDAGMPSGKDMVDIEHTVLSYEVVKGDVKYADHSLGVYLRVTCTLDQDAPKLVKLMGETHVYACGAPNVVTLLYKARATDRLPLSCVIRSKDTDNGTLLLLRLTPKRAI